MALAHTSRHWSRGSPCPSKPLCLLLAPEMPRGGSRVSSATSSRWNPRIWKGQIFFSKPAASEAAH